MVVEVIWRDEEVVVVLLSFLRCGSRNFARHSKHSSSSTHRHCHCEGGSIGRPSPGGNKKVGGVRELEEESRVKKWDLIGWMEAGHVARDVPVFDRFGMNIGLDTKAWP